MRACRELKSRLRNLTSAGIELDESSSPARTLPERAAATKAWRSTCVQTVFATRRGIRKRIPSFDSADVAVPLKFFESRTNASAPDFLTLIVVLATIRSIALDRDTDEPVPTDSEYIARSQLYASIMRGRTAALRCSDPQGIIA